MNNLPADHVAFFYDRGRLVRIKVALEKAAYDDAIGYLKDRYGDQPRWIPDKAKNGRGLSVWTAGKGILVAEAQRPQLNETTLLWLSSKDLVAENISKRLERVSREQNRSLPTSA